MTRSQEPATLHDVHDEGSNCWRAIRSSKGPKDWLLHARECFIIPARVIATSFALICFAAALWLGVRAGNPTITILLRAIILMGVAWGVGIAVGGIALRTIEEHLASYRAAHPIQPDLDETGTGDAEVAMQEVVAEGESTDIAGPEAAPRTG